MTFWFIVSATHWTLMTSLITGNSACDASMILCFWGEVPFTPQNSFQVKFLKVVDERPQAADHCTLQGSNSGQSVRAWRTQTHKHAFFSGRKRRLTSTSVTHQDKSGKADVNRCTHTHLSPGCGSRTQSLCSLQRWTQTERCPSSQLSRGRQPEH